MAIIRLDNVRHSYLSRPTTDDDWALKKIDLEVEDGGAYALLGPSGCGKTTMLNLISGLLTPSEGRILFDDDDVTRAPTTARKIAQVFQFPVVYDTMTVRENLAFPLKNRGVSSSEIKSTVDNIASVLGLEGIIDRKAKRLTADVKQKISLGRGLVRSDVNAILFDEPLTVIDPLLKWQLRSEIRKLHDRLGFTMIYVTHDQTEALTFADRVVVMFEGEVVQIGSSQELFERPQHTFVGYFIGSPGMNVMPCRLDEHRAVVGDQVVREQIAVKHGGEDTYQIGVRPEFVRFTSSGIPVRVNRVADVGTHQVVEATLADQDIKILVPEMEPVPDGAAWVTLDPDHTHFYRNGWLQA